MQFEGSNHPSTGRRLPAGSTSPTARRDLHVLAIPNWADAAGSVASVFEEPGPERDKDLCLGFRLL